MLKEGVSLVASALESLAEFKNSNPAASPRFSLPRIFLQFSLSDVVCDSVTRKTVQRPAVHGKRLRVLLTSDVAP